MQIMHVYMSYTSRPMIVVLCTTGLTSSSSNIYDEVDEERLVAYLFAVFAYYLGSSTHHVYAMHDQLVDFCTYILSHSSSANTTDGKASTKNEHSKEQDTSKCAFRWFSLYQLFFFA